MHRNDFASISIAFPRPAERSNATAHKIAEMRSFLAMTAPPFDHAAYADASTMPSRPSRPAQFTSAATGLILALAPEFGARNRTPTCQLKRSIAPSLPPEIAQRRVIVGTAAERPMVSAVALVLKRKNV